ncbi:uncharacterized protein LOC108487937 [Gossypium arboreum]|uniref:uncharacterized protein LOC108487937 n=1 Tax=Gossypium arboreum TaxID=29729 RepID=UPI000818F670|nr:uncharacterized protein LOC108487937 [Gossypium arboreum]
MAEYWLEATERIMNDLDYTSEQKLKGAISFLRDEAYQWWLIVEKGTQPDHLNWDIFKSTFQGKYMGASYIDARRHEFMNLMQGDRSVAEYEAKFLRLSYYTRGILASEYDKCICFKDDLKDSLRVLIAPQRECEFTVLVYKAKIAEERPKKKAKPDGSVRVGASIAPTGIQPRGDCGRCHLGECLRWLRACLRCGSLEHRIRECPQWVDQMQALGSGIVQPQRAVQQPPKGHGPARGGNGIGPGWIAPGRGAGQTDVRQPVLVYAT